MPTDFATLFQKLLSMIQKNFFSFMTFPQDAEGALSTGETAPVDLAYDDNGLLLSRQFDRPDGLRQEDSYVDGVRSATLLRDVDDQFDWAEVTNRYDETGRIRKETTFDNGLLRVDTFQDGVRVRSFQTDPDDVDLKDWTLRDVSYDGSGTPLTRLTRYDDGIERLETFQEGIREVVVQEDLVLTAELWSQITTIFDSLGRLTSRDLVYDDGVLREDTFSAGVRQKTTVDDVEDAFDWDTIQFLYNPDGVVGSRQQVDDNEDVTLILFEDGRRAERVIVDKNNDEDWAVQITTYDDAGVTDVTEYVERGSVLDDYAPFFADDDMVFIVS